MKAEDRPVVLKVTVEVSQGRSETILVRKGDRAGDLAEAFCERHGLDASLVDPLAVHIAENVARTGSQEEENERPPRPRPASAPSTPARLRGSAQEPSAMRDGGNRFEWLHEDAGQRRGRMERLRQQVERDLEQAKGSEAKRLQRGCCDGPGSRLYQDAAQRQAKIRGLQARQEEARRLEEDQHTFKPAIAASQRGWQGVGRSLRDPDGSCTRSKLERLREQRQRSELEGCTFRPEIDHKSEELMAQRLSRVRVAGSLYDALYEDALRRKERLHDAARTLPPGVTFQPDTGQEQRPPNDETREDFLERMAHSKSLAERWLALKREAVAQEEAASAPQTPRRRPLQRRAGQAPLGEQLYEQAREKAARLQQQQARAASSSRPGTPRAGEVSQRLLEGSRRKRYRDLFTALTARDNEEKLRYATLDVSSLETELQDFLQPMLAYLEETGAVLDFERFCVALDCQRQQCAQPTSHLFLWKSGTGRGRHLPEPTATAATTPRSRPNSAGPHERLYRESLTREARATARKNQREERELQTCTFQPSTPRSSSAGALAGRAGSPRTPPRASPRRRSGPPQALIAQISAQGARVREEVEASLSSSCRDGMGPSRQQLSGRSEPAEEQISLSEQAVAHCRTVLASARGAALSGF